MKIVLLLFSQFETLDALARRKCWAGFPAVRSCVPVSKEGFAAAPRECR